MWDECGKKCGMNAQGHSSHSLPHRDFIPRGFNFKAIRPRGFCSRGIIPRGKPLKIAPYVIYTSSLPKLQYISIENGVLCISYW